ncbi:bestrophin-like domain [Flindersiella endophytica]
MTHHHARRSRLAGVLLLAAMTALTGLAYLLLRRAFDLPMWAEAGLLVAMAVEFAQLGLSVVWVFYPPEEEDNDAVEAAFTTIAAIYALLFGFAIVVVWQANADANRAVAQEVSAVAEIDRMADGFSAEVQAQVDETSLAYVRSAIAEWPSIDHGGSSDQTADALSGLWNVYTSMDARERASPLYAQSVSRLNQLSDSRRARLSAGGSAMPSLLWFLLLGGALLTVFLAYLFRVSNTRLQRILVTLMAVVMVLALYLLAALDRPFDNKLAVSPEGFEQVLSSLR